MGARSLASYAIGGTLTLMGMLAGMWLLAFLGPVVGPSIPDALRWLGLIAPPVALMLGGAVGLALGLRVGLWIRGSAGAERR